MTPWAWYAGELDSDVYDLAAECTTRDEAIGEACASLKVGDQFRVIEARASTAQQYEGDDFVPFLRTRNKEVVTVGPRRLI